MSKILNAAFLQFKPEIAKPEENLKQVEGLLSKIKPETELVVLPELAFTGYNFSKKESIFPFAEKFADSKTVEFLAKQAKKHEIYLVAGFPELDSAGSDKIYNSSMLVGPEGLIGTYQKVHLFGNEKNIFEPGQEFKVFPLKLPKSRLEIKLGILVCFDWIFAESWLALFNKGADVITHCTNLVLPGRAQKAIPVMSMMHRIPVILANRFGDEQLYPEADVGKALNFTGNSIITDAHGEILVSAPNKSDCVGCARINISDARDKQVTKQNNLISDRMSWVYEKNDVIQKPD